MPDSSLLAPWSHVFRRTRDGRGNALHYPLQLSQKKRVLPTIRTDKDYPALRGKPASSRTIRACLTERVEAICAKVTEKDGIA